MGHQGVLRDDRGRAVASQGPRPCRAAPETVDRWGWCASDAWGDAALVPAESVGLEHPWVPEAWAVEKLVDRARGVRLPDEVQPEAPYTRDEGRFAGR